MTRNNMRDDFVLSLEFDNADNGAENFLFDNFRIQVDVGEDGRADEVAFRGSVHQ
jgi:hypothetical protein